jgi:hypothetical protein
MAMTKIAACLLKSQGIGVDEAFAMISRARGFSVPDTRRRKPSLIAAGTLDGPTAVYKETIWQAIMQQEESI